MCVDNFSFFFFLIQNSGFSLELPRRGGSDSFSSIPEEDEVQRMTCIFLKSC